MLENIYVNISIIKTIPVYLIYMTLKNRTLIDKDIERWSSYYNLEKYSKIKKLNWLLVRKKEYRNLFCYRIKCESKLKYIVGRIFYWPIKTLYIDCKHIGGGFMIWHGFSTIINAKSIGENCSIYQQVTIGNIEGGKPFIKNGVDISCGAIILGNITIGENSKIGANSTVTKNIPDNCTVVGVQAFIVKKNGIRVNEKL